MQEAWQEAFNECLLGVEIYPHGVLSKTASKRAGLVSRALKHAQVFAADEVQNFLDRTSQRTRTLYGNAADTVVLFTATPINRGVRDLIALIPTAALRAAFDHAPLWTKPLDKRIVAAIVGVPCA